MMEAVGRYIISVSAAAILCGILKSILPSKGTHAAILQLVSGIFLSLVTVQPLAQVDLGALPVISDAYLSEAQAAADQGELLARQAAADIIKTQAEAYILDKARLLHGELTVEVTLSDTDPPAPVSVRLSGSISPYAKSCLEVILQDDLGISKENQIWIG